MSSWATILIELFVIFLLPYMFSAWRNHRTKKKIRNLADQCTPFTPEDFLNYQAQLPVDHDFAGVYILCNGRKHKYYVGQSVHVYHRLRQHFTGRGNPDVYADYMRGRPFTIQVIPLEGSGFKTLNELERKAISTYDAYKHGYNKTRGNKG